jgi:hypothetical protein
MSSIMIFTCVSHPPMGWLSLSHFMKKFVIILIVIAVVQINLNQNNIFAFFHLILNIVHVQWPKSIQSWNKKEPNIYPRSVEIGPHDSIPVMTSSTAEIQIKCLWKKWSQSCKQKKKKINCSKDPDNNDSFIRRKKESGQLIKWMFINIYLV